MRAPGGMKVITAALEKMKAKHMEHMDLYGTDNDQRMTGALETSSFSEFSYGWPTVAAPCASPATLEKNGCGYFEERRPASNMDPYVVTGKIVQTTVLDKDAI